VADNGAERFPTRTALDAESKALAVFDPRGRRVMEYCLSEPIGGGGFRYVAGYDIAGKGVYANGMDGGERRTLNDVNGKPIRSWNARGFVFRTLYDALRRTTHLFSNAGGAAEILLERSIYGDRHPDPSLNLKGKLFHHYDGAGVAITERCDFKGNIVQTTRQLALGYQSTPDWTPLNVIADVSALNLAALDAAGNALLDPANRFTSITRVDALNRPIQLVTPHAAAGLPSVVQPSYNEAQLLEKVDVWIRRAGVPAGTLDPNTAEQHVLTNIDYDARGHRVRCDTGNGASTTYSYDAQTFRMTNLTTVRPNADPNARSVQFLDFTFDPSGNITRHPRLGGSPGRYLLPQPARGTVDRLHL
jgi:hypothetical protein